MHATVDMNAVTLATQSLPEPVDRPLDTDRITALVNSLDLSDSNSILRFGANAQSDLQTLSQSMLEGVRNKDVGPAGDALSTMVTTLRGFSISDADGRSKKTFFERLLGRATPLMRLMARFETVRGQIDSITDTLLTHESTLMRDIKMLDKLYEKTLAFYQELGVYIAAGSQKITELDTHTIPEMEAAVAAAAEDAQLLQAQALRDLRAARDDLERRVHDLRLTRQVTMQSLPSIRMVQENDKALVGKIASTMNNTIPLWETQLAQALTIQRSKDAAMAVRSANDLTNELLTANAENLRSANKIVREEMERGVFDIAAVKQANADLIATIEESLSITQSGKEKRKAAEAEMMAMETALRTTLAKASASK